jgi:hypothetical protein
MFHEKVIRNPILLIVMMLAEMVTSWYLSIIITGTPVVSTLMGSAHIHVLFPFRHPMSGPKMSSVVSISCVVIGQFRIRLFLTMWM